MNLSHHHPKVSSFSSKITPTLPHSTNIIQCEVFISKTPISHFSSYPFLHLACRAKNEPKDSILVDQERENVVVGKKDKENKSFWGAVGLIIGTAVGPGMLGLPSATIRSGPIPSTIAIILSWVYVISSIVLVAELSFAAMEDGGLREVSFTGIATDAFGFNFGAFVALVYACLSFSLMIACVSGIGSLVLQQFPMINPIIAHALYPCFAGSVIGFFPFEAIDVTNRLLCALMLVSITALVAIGLSVGRTNLFSSLAYYSWRPEVILPAIPVTVLTLGFHVITPFVCKLVGDSRNDARKAILFGGAVPLAMVLSWNLVVLGLAGTGNYEDPIKLLLSVNSSALPAVRGFAFAALATSLIGYAVSFPKQLVDTLRLVSQGFDKQMKSSQEFIDPHYRGRVGFALYSNGKVGAYGQASFAGRKFSSQCLAKDIKTESTNRSSGSNDRSRTVLVMWLVLIVPIFVASFFRTAFAKALDFAGVYANCFLFGVLPPAMAWIHRSRKRYRMLASKEDLLPGGNFVLLVLFGIAIILGIWH